MVRLCVYLLFFAVSVAVVIGYHCENKAVGCWIRSNYLKCEILSNDTQLIKSQIKFCSATSVSFNRLYLYKQYDSKEIGNLIVEIDLPPNIRALYIYHDLNPDNEYIRLTTSTYNDALISMNFQERVKIETPNFFNYFVQLERLVAFPYMINSEQTPSFTNLQRMILLNARFHISNLDAALDANMLSGLENLVFLGLPLSNFKRIEKNAFQNLQKLTVLNLNGNKVTRLQDGTFEFLKKLKSLHLDANGIKSVNNSIFEGLDELTTLSLNGNPNFPLESIIQTKKLINLRIGINNYTHLDPFVFQQLKDLRYLDAHKNPLICDCSLQWAPIMFQNDVYVKAICLEPWNTLGVNITTPLLYTNCTQTQSYKCFGKSISCPINQVCHNTGDSYTCGCTKGYALLSSGECSDINECDHIQKCEHGCENTKGSYICTCPDGSKLSSDGSTCVDVNECQGLVV